MTRSVKRFVLVISVLAMAVASSLITQVAFAELEEITSEVKSRLQKLEPPMAPFNVQIEYHNNGSIVLSGTVGNEADRRRAEAAALGAHGVSRVDNRLQVVSLAPPRAVAAVPSISEKILSAVNDEVKTGWYQINVGPSAGGIEVSGLVDNEETRSRIIDVATRLSGSPVKDRLLLRPAKPDAELEIDVSRILAQQFPALAPKLSVDVHSGTVRLTGDLSDHWDIDRVLASVVMLEGVKEIDSRVTINGAPYHSDRATTKLP